MADAWTALLGIDLLTKRGVISTATALARAQVVGLYFGAHWCPPCHVFTPVLGVTYDELKEAHGDAFEVVFVSSDSDSASFDAYYDDMPFAALPFAEIARRQALSAQFVVHRIPALVFLDASGDVITKDGDAVIRNADGDMSEIWTYLTT